MRIVHVILVTLILVAVCTSLFVYAKWPRILLASTFLVVQAGLLVFALDFRAGEVLKSEFKQGRDVNEMQRVVRAVRDEQFVDKFSAVLTGVGLFVLCVLPRRRESK